MERAEKIKGSKLAREFIVALPIEFELSKEAHISFLRDFIQKKLVDMRMCAVFAIHNTDGHNPHAHILLTVCPLEADGTWQYRTQKEYLCIRNGEEKNFTSSEFKATQTADVVNYTLQEQQIDIRVDYRIFADQRRNEQLTINEGYHARDMETKGLISDRRELNRPIRLDNRLFRKLKRQIERLSKTVSENIHSIAK